MKKKNLENKATRMKMTLRERNVYENAYAVAFVHLWFNEGRNKKYKSIFCANKAAVIAIEAAVTITEENL